MTDEEQTKICVASIHAQEIAEKMKVAYWTKENVREFHLKGAHDKFKQLAEVMGYHVELIE